MANSQQRQSPHSLREHPTAEFLRSIDIHKLLPQQEPFVMVDTLTALTPTATETETCVRPDNIFVDNGQWTATGLMENIAQTCAARIGYVNKYILEKNIQIGVIGAIRDFCVAALPAVGTTVTTRMEVVEEVMGMTLAHAEISAQGMQIAHCDIKIAIKGRATPTDGGANT